MPESAYRRHLRHLVPPLILEHSKQLQNADEDEDGEGVGDDRRYERSLSTTDGKRALVSNARLLHHFADDPGYAVALPARQLIELSVELQRHRDQFAVTAQRSAKVAESPEACRQLRFQVRRCVKRTAFRQRKQQRK